MTHINKFLVQREHQRLLVTANGNGDFRQSSETLVVQLGGCSTYAEGASRYCGSIGFDDACLRDGLELVSWDTMAQAVI
jgi:hypothetical protein